MDPPRKRRKISKARCNCCGSRLDHGGGRGAEYAWDTPDPIYSCAIHGTICPECTVECDFCKTRRVCFACTHYTFYICKPCYTCTSCGTVTKDANLAQCSVCLKRVCEACVRWCSRHPFLECTKCHALDEDRRCDHCNNNDGFFVPALVAQRREDESVAAGRFTLDSAFDSKVLAIIRGFAEFPKFRPRGLFPPKRNVRASETPETCS